MKTLKYAIRFLTRSKSYTLINLLGLAFSLACCIILLRYIHRETTVDSHCVDREWTIAPIRDIRVNANLSNTKYCDSLFIPDSKVVRRTLASHRADTQIKHNQQPYVANALLVDSEFLNIFKYPVVEGVPQLDNPDQVIITQEFARRLFGKNSAIGQVIEIRNQQRTVGAVIAPPSCKTTLHFDLLVPERSELMSELEFIQLLPGTDLDAINRASSEFKNIRLPDGKISSLSHRFKFVSMENLYFEKSIQNCLLAQKGMLKLGSSDYINILLIVAILLLFVGVLNFINLYMVYMMKRQKEYGIKKVYGLQKWPLFVQIWTENALLAFCALMVSWLLIEITQVPVARLMGTEMVYSPFDLQLSLAFLLVLPTLTSIYPYVRYQYTSPITSMRAIATNRQSVATRMLFLSLQYVITFTLMVFSLYLNKHFRFLLNSPTGFRSERILVLDTSGYGHLIIAGEATMDLKDALKIQQMFPNKLNECPDIEIWSNGPDIINGLSYLHTFASDKDETIELNMAYIVPSYLKVYGLETVEGHISDSIQYNFLDEPIILNRAAMKKMGYTRLDEAFVRNVSHKSAQIDADGSVTEDSSLKPVLAVIDDHYSGHLTEGIRPLLYKLNPIGMRDKYHLLIREGKEKEVLAYLRNTIQELYGTDELEYTWVTDQIKQVYDNDRKIATIYSVFALIAIAISSLGLFGISLFDIRQRYREIAIRKVNGAGMKDLYKLLFRKYALILAVSFAIAIPLAWYIIHSYTAGFAIKAPIGIGIFVIALLAVAFISLGTLYWQVRKAATLNAMEVIKKE